MLNLQDTMSTTYLILDLKVWDLDIQIIVEMIIWNHAPIHQVVIKFLGLFENI